MTQIDQLRAKRIDRIAYYRALEKFGGALQIPDFCMAYWNETYRLRKKYNNKNA